MLSAWGGGRLPCIGGCVSQKEFMTSVALKVEAEDFDGSEIKARASSLAAIEENIVNPYVLLLLRHWTLVALVTVVAVVGTFIYTKWFATKWYRATAVIAPVPEGAVENRVEGGIGSLSMSGMSSFLMSSGTDAQAQEYMTILRSFAFNTDLALRHDLVSDLLGDDPDDRPKAERALRMRLFDTLGRRFSVDYSIQGQNLSVHFLERDPLIAQQVLQYYLDDLRALRRREAIKSASAAIASLEKEAKETGDSLLSQQLYGLVARQVQRQKLAEVESDFAFRVLDPPISPDKPYWPRARINCFIALIAAPLLMWLVLVIYSLAAGIDHRTGRTAAGRARPRAAGERNGAF
jgi:hypothetical protein